MALHLLKMAVGIESVRHLETVQAARREQYGRVFHVTRFAPRRADEVLAGGSLYWIIKRQIRVRQAIIGIEPIDMGEGAGRKTALILDPDVVRTSPTPRRPHQGWRYLEPEDAPPDLSSGGPDGDDVFPPELAAELRTLGLL